MDPDLLLTLATDGDRDAAEALLEWVDRGGFIPDGFVRAHVERMAGRQPA